MYENLFTPCAQDYELIEELSGLLSNNNIPHNVHTGPSNGWQITFDWCKGDVVCSWATFHLLESYRFPWDEGDVTRTDSQEFAKLISQHYKDIVFTEEDA